MFVFEAYRFAAIVTQRRPDRVERPAVSAEDLGRIERIDLDLRRAVLTIGSEVLEALEVAALTLPVAYLVLDEL